MRCALLLLLAGCTQVGSVPPETPKPAAATKGVVREGTPDDVNIAKARGLGRQQLFSWVEWSAASFARAKSEGRFILVHGAAGWCHWCHVMEETTYRHPEVGAILRDKFVAIRVDIDARPDIEERYADWGWPATIILNSSAEEIGKFRGYIPADEMINTLKTLDGRSMVSELPDFPPERPAAVEALPWIGANASRRLDTYYDPKHGSWGMRQKAPIGENISWELRKYQNGDKSALERARYSLQMQAALIDPVWGGIYQYSSGSTWTEPHYEKLMTYQAANLSAYADGYRHTKDPQLLTWARAIERYMNTFLSNDAGGFLVTQDADVGAHDRDATFVDGDVYYKLDNAARRKLGIPRIDAHVYAEENGLAIAAMCDLYAATKDAQVLARATKAAKLVLASHVDAEGRVLHDAGRTRAVWHLGDAAAFGFALVRVAEIGGDASYTNAALKIASFMDRELRDSDGAYWANTPDAAASGVFNRRRKPYAGNVNAARLFAALARVTGDAAWFDKARTTLAGISQPLTLRFRGRMVGGYLLALDDAGALRWKSGE
jgi:uncharacterized protein YyaL (SSP411 family)